jgi:hypothetical protein
MRYRVTLCNAAAIALGATLTVMISADAGAQTLTNPNPPAPSHPPPAAKLDKSAHVKSCSAYGAGFVNIPVSGGQCAGPARLNRRKQCVAGSD